MTGTVRMRAAQQEDQEQDDGKVKSEDMWKHLCIHVYPKWTRMNILGGACMKSITRPKDIKIVCKKDYQIIKLKEERGYCSMNSSKGKAENYRSTEHDVDCIKSSRITRTTQGVTQIGMVCEECLQPPNALLPKQVGQPSNQAVDTDALRPSAATTESMFTSLLVRVLKTLCQHRLKHWMFS